MALEEPLPYAAFTVARVRSLLAVTDEERRLTRATIDRVAGALRQGFHPQKVYLGGSFKKGTSLRGLYDVDLVVFVNGFRPEKMNEYRARAKAVLGDNGVLYENPAETPYCLKIDCLTGFEAKPQLHFDVLFTGDIREKPPDALERFYRSAESPDNDDMVMSALDSTPGVLELILLTKHWREKQSFTTFGVSSFYVELVCISIMQQSSVADLQHCFRLALRRLSVGHDMQTAHGVVEVPEDAVEECRGRVESTLDAMGPEFVYLPPSTIRFAQKSIGCNFRDGRSLGETACQLARADIEKRDVEMIRIVKHDDGLYYCMDNRRLAVFRLLEFVGKTRIVKARVVQKDPKEWAFKFDTNTNGLSVVVRGTAYVIGPSVEGTTYPLETLRATEASAAVGAELPAMESDDEEVGVLQHRVPDFPPRVGAGVCSAGHTFVEHSRSNQIFCTTCGDMRSDRSDDGLMAGVIAMWSGPADALAVGWNLCDGLDGRPDLRDKFVRCAGTTYPPHTKGGRPQVDLLLENLPAHKHAR